MKKEDVNTEFNLDYENKVKQKTTNKLNVQIVFLKLFQNCASLISQTI